MTHTHSHTHTQLFVVEHLTLHAARRSTSAVSQTCMTQKYIQKAGKLCSSVIDCDISDWLNVASTTLSLISVAYFAEAPWILLPP